jgi:hypothetical protein
MMTFDDITVAKTMVKPLLKKAWVTAKFAWRVIVASVFVVGAALVIGTYSFFDEAGKYMSEQCADAFKETYDEFQVELTEIDD